VMGILKTLALVCVFTALGIGLVFLKGYVDKVTDVSDKTGLLELLDPPKWLNEPLKNKIYDAATANGEDLKLDEDAAQSVQQNIQSLVVWVDKVKVRINHGSILIEAAWRKPLGLIRQDPQCCYVDAERVVLDFVPMPSLPIVKITGLSTTTFPSPGDVWQSEDLAAAVDILNQLDQMDRLVTPDKPLLREIDRIDVSNFNGRKSAGSPHIVLYASDDTKIIWGAAVGKWQRYLEATDEEKLARLYGYYKEYGSLLGVVKYINLRDPQNNIHLPIDKD
jgi:hypothetical protein